MADYGCDPLWWADADKVGNIDPARLPLSQETINHLRKWATDYNATLNWQDPGNSLDLSPEEEAAFEQEGILVYGNNYKKNLHLIMKWFISVSH